ncbi:hypothetical protein [Azospirillum sp. SYSU D00513]|nr:hypothetical protein [Azospirillum sp. SYSU D00513]
MARGETIGEATERLGSIPAAQSAMEHRQRDPAKLVRLLAAQPASF